jgi:hypothetical protein
MVTENFWLGRKNSTASYEYPKEDIPSIPIAGSFLNVV